MTRGLLVFPLLAAVAHAQVSACAPCHADIVESYAKTGMSRSFYPMRSEVLPEKPYYHEASDSYFFTVEHGGKYFQRRWQVGHDGKETNVEEKRIDFVVGSGNHARTYLHLTPRGTLQQLPLGWYAEDGGMWAMNPGYDRPDYPGSTRAISYECMFCHNAYPRTPAANREHAAEPKYLPRLPQGIDCQRCHGGGRRHIATSGKAAIVNPKKLAPDRALEVCLQCHLETSSLPLPHSILKHGRGPFSYAPGMPLGDFQLAFDRAPGKNTAVEVAGGAYRLRQSACFLRSDGKLLKLGNILIETAHWQRAESILRRATAAAPSDPLAWGLLGWTLWQQDRRAEGRAALENALKLDPDVPELHNYLGGLLAATGDNAGAESEFREAVRISPGIAEWRANLGGFLASQGRISEARWQFEQAVRLKPAYAIGRFDYGRLLAALGETAAAETHARVAVQSDPNHAGARELLGALLVNRGDRAGALTELRAAIKLAPDFARAHFELGMALYLDGQVDAALTELHAASKLGDPDAAAMLKKLGG